MLLSTNDAIQYDVPAWWIETSPAPEGSPFRVVAANPYSTTSLTFVDDSLHPASVEGGYLLQFFEILSGEEDIGFKTVTWIEDGVDKFAFVYVQVWAVFDTVGKANYLLSFLNGDLPSSEITDTATQIINSALDFAPPADQTLAELMAGGFVPVGLAENAIAVNSRRQIYDGQDDVILGDGFHETIYAMRGNDEVKGRNGNDTLYGGEGDDRLFGGGQSDALYGGDGRDRLNGGNGRDILNGGTGSDILRGGSGADSFVFLVQDGDVSRDKILDLDIADVANGRLWLEVYEFVDGIETFVPYSALKITQDPVAALISYKDWSVAIKEVTAVEVMGLLDL